LVSASRSLHGSGTFRLATTPDQAVFSANNRRYGQRQANSTPDSTRGITNG